jgi:hypothetical protein
MAEQEADSETPSTQQSAEQERLTSLRETAQRHLREIGAEDQREQEEAKNVEEVMRREEERRSRSKAKSKTTDRSRRSSDGSENEELMPIEGKGRRMRSAAGKLSSFHTEVCCVYRALASMNPARE